MGLVVGQMARLGLLGWDLLRGLRRVIPRASAILEALQASAAVLLAGLALMSPTVGRRATMGNPVGRGPILRMEVDKRTTGPRWAALAPIPLTVAGKATTVSRWVGPVRMFPVAKVEAGLEAEGKASASNNSKPC